MGISTRINGQAPPDIPLSDVDLGLWDFWGYDDDLRDGAFTTLRREAPISFHPEPHLPGVPDMDGFPVGPGHWALTTFDDVHYASRHPGDLQLRAQHHHRRSDARTRSVLRVDDRHG